MKNKKLNIMEEHALRNNVQTMDERIKSGEVYNMDSLIGLRRLMQLLLMHHISSHFQKRRPEQLRMLSILKK